MLVEWKSVVSCNIYLVFLIYFTLYEGLFASQPELTIFAFYFQDGGKTGAQKIEVLEHKLTYFDDQSIHISLSKVEILS